MFSYSYMQIDFVYLSYWHVYICLYVCIHTYLYLYVDCTLLCGGNKEYLSFSIKYRFRDMLLKKHTPLTSLIASSGWVVTWFLLNTLHGCSNTLHWYSGWSNVSSFLYVFSSIPRKLCTIFQHTFSPIKQYQGILFKLLTLSTEATQIKKHYM